MKCLLVVEGNLAKKGFLTWYHGVFPVESRPSLDVKDFLDQGREQRGCEAAARSVAMTLTTLNEAQVAQYYGLIFLIRPYIVTYEPFVVRYLIMIVDRRSDQKNPASIVFGTEYFKWKAIWYQYETYEIEKIPTFVRPYQIIVQALWGYQHDLVFPLLG